MSAPAEPAPVAHDTTVVINEAEEQPQPGSPAFNEEDAARVAHDPEEGTRIALEAVQNTYTQAEMSQVIDETSEPDYTSQGEVASGPGPVAPEEPASNNAAPTAPETIEVNIESSENNNNNA